MVVSQLTEANIIKYLLSVVIPVATLYITNKAKIKEAEHRTTVLEMEVRHLKESVEQNALRLDGHDEQNRMMYALIEQVKSLTSSMEEVKRDVKTITERGK